MYAIIQTGGKQYKVQAGDILQIEGIEQELGSEFKIQDVLMIGGDKSHVGAPLVKNASVTAVVTKQARTRKVIVFKKKRRQGYRRFGTHKQPFTEIFIKTITSPDGASVKADSEPVVKDMAALRKERIQTKMEDRKARVSVREGDVEAAPESAPKKKATKKAAPKKATAKKAASKKAKAPSKRSVKTAAKKAAKKTKKAK